MKTFTIMVYSDPAHSWGKVKRQVIDNLGLAQGVSDCSYQLRDNVYLEEDHDLGLLCGELHQRGVRIKFVYKHTDKASKIRSYESYQPTV